MSYIACTPQLLPALAPTSIGLLVGDSAVHSIEAEALGTTGCIYQHVYLLSERPINSGNVYFDKAKQQVLVAPEMGAGYFNRYPGDYIRVEASTDPSLGLPVVNDTVLAAYVKGAKSSQTQFRVYPGTLPGSVPVVGVRMREYTGTLYNTDQEPRALTLAELIEVGVGQVGSTMAASAFGSGYLLNDGKKSAHHFYSAPDWAIYGTNEWVPNEAGRLAVNAVMGKEHYKGGEDYLPGSIIIYKREDFVVF
jgi:hypothetical protein